MTLRELITYCKKGRTKAQRALFDLTCDQLKSVAMRYVVDSSAAEDVLQESYIRIFKGIDQFQYVNDAATHGWMRRITTTEALRYLKKNRNWHRAMNDGIEMEMPTVEQDHALFRDELFQLLMALPLNQRMVFNLAIIEGYSHKEIAEQLGIAVSSSRSLLTRARALLQSRIIKNDSYANV